MNDPERNDPIETSAGTPDGSVEGQPGVRETLKPWRPGGGSPRPRAVVVQTVYHQIPKEGVFSVDSRYTRWLTSDEQPYTRKLKVNPEWRRLDFGWLACPSGVILSNDEGPCKNPTPTGEENASTLMKTVLVGVKPPETEAKGRTMWSAPKPDQEPIVFCQLRPGESLRMEPFPETQYVIKCLGEEVKCTLTCIPD